MISEEIYTLCKVLNMRNTNHRHALWKTEFRSTQQQIFWVIYLPRHDMVWMSLKRFAANEDNSCLCFGRTSLIWPKHWPKLYGTLQILNVCVMQFHPFMHISITALGTKMLNQSGIRPWGFQEHQRQIIMHLIHREGMVERRKPDLLIWESFLSRLTPASTPSSLVFEVLGTKVTLSGFLAIFHNYDELYDYCRISGDINSY